MNLRSDHKSILQISFKRTLRDFVNHKDKWILVSLLFLFTILLFSQKILLVSADLGRHITNGKLTVTEGKILETNYYSYTEPNIEVVNHHWGSGVLFYLIWKLFNFTGVSIFYVLVNTRAFLLIFITAKRRSRFIPLLFFSLLALPLIAYRTEIRPEGFSYLLIALYIFIFNTYRSKKIPRKIIILLTLLQILWVNLHIYFILGIGIALAYTVEYIKLNKRQYLKERIILILLLIIASLCNPFFLKGFLEPFLIFRQYGYQVYENQSILFLQKRFSETIFIHVELLIIISFITIVYLYFKKYLSRIYPETILVIICALLSWKMVRAFPLFSFAFIPFSTKAFNILSKNMKETLHTYIHYSMISLSLLMLFLGFITTKNNYSPFSGNFGLGLAKNIQSSAEFYKKNSLKGPIFNNYDIGGYLIYNLYPQEKVFVDNRPEAYSVSFLQEIYIPMQENEDTWKDSEELYHFNVIYFNRRDITPWAQTFLVNRINDSKWVPVYVDEYTIIFLKNTKENKKVISEFKIPRKNFQIVTSEY